MSWKDKKFVKAHVLKQFRNNPNKIVILRQGSYKTLSSINGSEKVEIKDYIYFEHNNNFVKVLLNRASFFNWYQIRKEYSDNLDKVKLALKSIS